MNRRPKPPLLAAPPDYSELAAKLGLLAPIEPLDWPPATAFAMVFAQMYAAMQPMAAPSPAPAPAQAAAAAYPPVLSPGWAYHVALAMAQAAQLLGLHCTFADSPRGHDHQAGAAVLETRSAPSRRLLAAEWSDQFNEVFGRGKELERLSAHCHASTCADGLLVCACRPEVYTVFATNVTETWLQLTRTRASAPRLYLQTVLAPLPLLAEAPALLRPLAIHPARIQLWPDVPIGG
jgi:hypothetical protein